jgi:hypothetical protein
VQDVTTPQPIAMSMSFACELIEPCTNVAPPQRLTHCYAHASHAARSDTPSFTVETPPVHSIHSIIALTALCLILLHFDHLKDTYGLTRVLSDVNKLTAGLSNFTNAV